MHCCAKHSSIDFSCLCVFICLFISIIYLFIYEILFLYLYLLPIIFNVHVKFGNDRAEIRN